MWHPDVPLDQSPASRSEGEAAVAAGTGEGVDAALEALRAGGNAFDAVVAAALVDMVGLPAKCGLAGDVAALVVEAGREPASLVALGRAPATPSGLANPAAASGLAVLADRGRLGLDALCAPAVALARRGAAWHPIMATLTHDARDRLRANQPGGSAYTPADGPHRVGDRVVLAGMAELIERFAAAGAGLFAEPDLAAAVSARMAEVEPGGGERDPTDVHVEWAPALRGTAAGTTTTWFSPAPTAGPTVAAAVERAAGSSLVDAVRDLRPVRTTTGTSVVGAVDGDDTAVVVAISNGSPMYGSGVVVPGLDLVLSDRTRSAAGPGGLPSMGVAVWAVESERGVHVGSTPAGIDVIGWHTQLVAHLARGGAPEEVAARPMFEVRPDGSIKAEVPPDGRVPAWADQVVGRLRAGVTIVTGGRPGAAVAVGDGRLPVRTGAIS
ncbi:MAG: gamma-glutamyltransferase [Actinomycetota bacterium]|nr:gamma-glutamyltransferase [Actinomycetota bacterium]